jgi:general secretion pathway protein D
MQLNGDLKLLSTPSLLVADNEASRIFIGTETTILTELNVESNTTSGNNPVTTYSYEPTTQRRNVGTTLLITPKIHADRSVTIRLMQETSDRGGIQKVVYGTNQLGGIQYFDTTDINQRIVTTTVEARDSQIIAIGGLIRESIEERIEGAPIAKDIPLIGTFFNRTTKQKIRSELIILIRPYVLLAPGETQKASDELLERLSRHKTAQKGHKELNLDIEDIKKDDDKKHRTGIKWLDDWLYPDSENKKHSMPAEKIETSSE